MKKKLLYDLDFFLEIYSSKNLRTIHKADPEFSKGGNFLKFKRSVKSGFGAIMNIYIFLLKNYSEWHIQRDLISKYMFTRFRT